jgi:hypothetical protein
MAPSSSRTKRNSLPEGTTNDEDMSQSGSDELSEATTQETHAYEGKLMITHFSHTEEDRLLDNYTNPNYSSVKFNAIEEASFTGTQQGLGYQKPPPKSKIIGLLELENGARVPMNELQNKYASKVLLSGLSQWINTDTKGSPEQFSKKVIIQEIALLTQLAGFDPESTTDRIRNAIHNLMLGFNSNVSDINREAQHIAGHFMKMRIGDIPVECGQLGAMNMAIDSYFERCGQDHKISQVIKYHGWRIMILLLINGHLEHNKIEPIPFSPVKSTDEGFYKGTRIHNSKQKPFAKTGVIMEVNEDVVKSYKAYLSIYDAYVDQEEHKRLAMVELAASNPSQENGQENGSVHKKSRLSSYGAD